MDAGIARNPRKTSKQVVLKPILSKFHSYFGKQPVHIVGEKMTDFSLNFAKKHSLITQKRFWCLFWLLGDPRTTYFGCLSLYFDNFFARKMVGSRETPRDGVSKLFSVQIKILNTCKFFWVKNFSPLILPKKHSMITQ